MCARAELLAQSPNVSDVLEYLAVVSASFASMGKRKRRQLVAELMKRCPSKADGTSSRDFRHSDNDSTCPRHPRNLLAAPHPATSSGSTGTQRPEARRKRRGRRAKKRGAARTPKHFSSSSLRGTLAERVAAVIEHFVGEVVDDTIAEYIGGKSA